MDFEALPEFIREPYTSTRDSLLPSSGLPPSGPTPPFSSRPLLDQSADSTEEPTLAKTAELEALWPGVSHHEVLRTTSRTPAFYLSVGFAAGVLATLVSVWSYSLFSHSMVANNDQTKPMVVSRSSHGGSGTESASRNGQVTTKTASGDIKEVIVPLSSSYEVKSGDTLATIALQNYRRVSPRLIDDICRANNMRNANVLKLGQKILLPEYHPQSSQIAAGAAQIQ